MKDHLKVLGKKRPWGRHMKVLLTDHSQLSKDGYGINFQKYGLDNVCPFTTFISSQWSFPFQDNLNITTIFMTKEQKRI